MNVSGCSDDAALARDIQSLNARFLIAIASGLDACKQFLAELQPLLQHARQRLYSGTASHELAQTMAAAAGPLDAICTMLVNVETQRTSLLEEQTATFDDIFARAGLRRKRKRSTRSRKSKAGKNGKVRQSGKKSKRGRKSPVGNPKKRMQSETMSGKPGQSKKGDLAGRKSRNVTAPPTDSMKFGPCRDFFLSHLGDPYPTTVQKHQILKQSSPDFTLRSLNLWFVNIRRRSKWMDIFKKHAGSKRDAMRDLVARVEAQVAGRPAPNPLPSGAAPPGCKVDSAIVEEVMAMRAVVDMVSREVYGEGWDQILQIRPWTDEEVRAHEERKKASRREARAAKADEGKRKRDREEQRLQQKREREQRKRIEQEAVEGIRAARELHLKLMAMNKRKRDDDDESDVESKRRKSKDTDLGDGESKKRKLKVPKYDDAGNALTKEQRKAIKRAMLAAQAQQNPLKRKSPELNDAPGVSMHDDMAMDTSPSKRRRRDALTFDGFPSAGETEGAAGEAEGPGMADLTQLFSMEWASPPRESQPLPAVSDDRSATTATATSNTAATSPQHGGGYGGFALPSDSHPPVAAGPIVSTEGEVPRRFSQQLAAFALESGMFDTQNFELFTGDTFPGMEVDVHSAAPMPAGPSENMFGSTSMGGVPDFGSNGGQSSLHLNTNTPAAGSMSVSPSQTHSQLHTPMQQLATPTQHHVPQFEFAQPGDHHHHHHARSGHESNGYMDSSQHSNADSSDMSWINAALEHLPSQHDVARAQQQQQQQQQPPHFAGHGHGQDFQSGGFTSSFPAQNATEYESRPPTAMSVPDWQQDRAQRVHPSQPSQQPQQQQQQQRPSFPQAPSPALSPMVPMQSRPSFPQPQAKPQSQSSAPKQRAPGSLWQTPHSQPAPQRYTTPGPSTYQAPPPPPPASFAAPPPPHSFPAPATPQYAPQQPNQLYGAGQPDRRGASSSSPSDSGSYGQRYAPSPAYQEPQPQRTQPSPSPSVDPKDALKDREAEFARAQEALQAQFRREQEEQLARFMRAQEELRNQLLGSR